MAALTVRVSGSFEGSFSHRGYCKASFRAFVWFSDISGLDTLKPRTLDRVQ